jgi:hypothetical protein
MKTPREAVRLVLKGIFKDYHNETVFFSDKRLKFHVLQHFEQSLTLKQISDIQCSETLALALERNLNYSNFKKAFDGLPATVTVKVVNGPVETVY